MRALYAAPNDNLACARASPGTAENCWKQVEALADEAYRSIIQLEGISRPQIPSDSATAEWAPQNGNRTHPHGKLPHGKLPNGSNLDIWAQTGLGLWLRHVDASFAFSHHKHSVLNSLQCQHPKGS
eukprot:s361_g16.t1